MGWFFKSEGQTGYEVGKDAMQRGEDPCVTSFTNQINPFTSKEYKDGFERAIDQEIERRGKTP